MADTTVEEALIECRDCLPYKDCRSWCLACRRVNGRCSHYGENAAVKTALFELQEMFPGEINLGIERIGGDGYIAPHGRICLRDEHWSIHRKAIEVIGKGRTLEEAMDQARQYRNQQ